MTLPMMCGAQPTRNGTTVLQVSFTSVSLANGVAVPMYLQSIGGTLQVGYFTAFTPVSIQTLTGSCFLSSGSTAGTVQFLLQSASMSTATSGVGGKASGAFATVSGIATGSVTPTTTVQNMGPYTAGPLVNTTYPAGTIFQVVAMASGVTVSNFSGTATLRVCTYV